jgi:hypothetical protein
MLGRFDEKLIWQIEYVNGFKSKLCKFVGILLWESIFCDHARLFGESNKIKNE